MKSQGGKNGDMYSGIQYLKRLQERQQETLESIKTFNEESE